MAIKLAKKKKTGDIQLISNKGEIISEDDCVHIRFKTSDKRKPSFSVVIDGDDLIDLYEKHNFNKANLEFQQQNEEAKMKHTKLPWHTGVGCLESVHAEDSSCVCDCDCGEPNKTILANAAFIVKAVNNHEKLIKALRDVAGFLLCDGQDVEAKFNPCKDEISQQINMIRKAIKQAEES